MEIIVKEVNDKNHIYLFDNSMRPLTINVVSKRKTKTHIKNMVKKNNINNIRFLNHIDFSESVDCIIDRIL